MEVVQILVVVAMIAIAVWQKRREKQVKRVQTYKRQLQGHIDAHRVEVSSPALSEMKPAKRKSEARKSAVQAVSPPSPASAHKKQDASLSLRTPEEARRAFLYSEIFNRKYE